MQFSDSHCHIDFPELSNNLNVLLEQCSTQGIKRIIVPAVSPKLWPTLLATCLNNDLPCELLPCLGIHPWYLNKLTHEHLKLLESTFIKNQKSIIAIGETGIDGVIAKEQNNLSKQQEFFQFHIELANKYQLPLIVHHRRSHHEITQQLKTSPIIKGGIIHAFSGSYEQGKTYIDLGFKLGIGGTITYSRAEKTIKAIKRLPLDMLVLETDAPSMPLSGEQGKPNSPLNVIKVFEHLCLIRSETKEEIAQTIESNINQLLY